MRTTYRSGGPNRTRRSDSSNTGYPKADPILFPERMRAIVAFFSLLVLILPTDFAHGQGPLTNGWTHTGLIGVGAEVDSWTFSANAGERIVVRVGEITQTNAFTPRIRLVNPPGTQQATASGAVAAEVSVVATNTGTFTVMIDGVDATATGAYRLTLAKTPGGVSVAPGDEGGPLINGRTYTGVMELGDLDVWTFTANAGDTIFVAMGESVAGSALTPALWLYGPDGRLLASYGSSAVAAEISARATNSGTFTVVAGDFSNAYTGSGAYRLTMVKTGDPITVSPDDQGGPMTNAVTHTGEIYVGDLDVWSFTASAGENLTVRVGELVSGSPLTPSLWLLGPNGAQLDFYASSSIAGEVSVRATNNGTFTVVVGDWNNDFAGSGAYRLTLAKTGSPVVISPGDEGGPLINGQTYTATIDAGDLDVWTITANTGDSIFVAMGETVAGSALTPALWLYGPDGRLLTSYGSSSVAAEIYTRATNSGTFTLVAGDFSNAYAGSGGYRLTLVMTGDPITVSPGDHGGPMTNAVTHTGEIYVGDLDVWSFTASAGENLTIRIGELVAGSPLIPALWLFGPNGAQLDFYANSSVAGEVGLRATNSGTFTVVVGDNNNAYAGSGTYRLTLAKTGSPIVISPGDEGGPMTNGVIHTGTIDIGDIDVWSFTANAGDSIFVAMGESVAASALTPALWLYGPDGRLLTSYGGSSVAAEINTRATNSGTFTVVAGDFSNAYGGSGTYRLTMVKTGDPIVVSAGDHGGPLTNGVTHLGDIYIGDIDIWNFTASAGENITVRMGELVSGSSLTPAVWLYGPDGRLLDSMGNSGFAAEVSVRATNSGTFTVVVGDFSNAWGGSGGYRLTLAKTGSPLVISAGDEGGALVNGLMHTGTIDLGDIDVWSFTANAGDSIVVRMGETAAGSALTPALWFYGTDGRLLDSYGNSGVAAEVAFRATNSGTFTIVAGDFSNAYGGTGDYRLTLAKTGAAVFVSDGDQGGPLNGSDNYDGVLDAGDLDVFYFTLCRGDDIVVRLDEATAGLSLTPWVRLYGREGTLIRSLSGAATAQFSLLATNTGTFILVLGDFSSAYAGSGAYRLTVNGLSAGLKMCAPTIAGTNAALSGVGGVFGEEFVVLTSPLVEAPLATWTPILTNVFDFYGTFNRTSRYISTEPRRFYIIRQSGGIGEN